MSDHFAKLSRLLMIVFLLASGIAIPSGKARASAGATYTVNSHSDADNASDGVCTLREAITADDGHWDYHECIHTGSFGDDLIFFSISGSTTITLAANLPAIAIGSSGSLTIDGSNSGRSVVINGANAYQPFNIYGGVSFTLKNLTVQHGLSSSGGGALNYGTLNVLNSSFLNNVSSGDGGAIENAGTVTIANSTFSGNSAHYGGGLTNTSGTATILNSTFSGNSASYGGGALSTWQGGPTTPVTTVKNTILANSSAPEDCWNGNGGTPTGDHNIIETTSGYGVTTCSGIATSNADPKLGSLTGSPAYFPLLALSPALDAGDNATCAASPVSNTSQNGVTRPQGSTCDIGAFEAPAPTVTIKSAGAQDGWVLESSETSGVGGTLSAAGNFRLGDDKNRKQYIAVASFATGTPLPDTAVVTGVTLKLKKAGVTGGGDPVAIFSGFMLDVMNGTFGTTPLLETADFQAAASDTYGPSSPPLVGGWYSFDLTPGAADINKTDGGLTQIRLRFQLDDNNDMKANYLNLDSGNAGAASRPQLIIQYYVP